MDDQSAAVRPEMPLVPRDATGGTGSAPIDDPRALTILSTEHYSLLTARPLERTMRDLRAHFPRKD